MKVALSNRHAPDIRLKPYAMDYGEVQIPAGILQSGAPIGVAGRTLEVDVLGKTPYLSFSPGKLVQLDGEWFRGIFDIVLFIDKSGKRWVLPLAMSGEEFFGSGFAIDIDFEYRFPEIRRSISLPGTGLGIIQDLRAFGAGERSGAIGFSCSIRVTGADSAKGLWFNPKLMGFGMEKERPGMQDSLYSLSFFSGNQGSLEMANGFRHESLAPNPKGLTGMFQYTVPDKAYSSPSVRAGHRGTLISALSRPDSAWPEDGPWLAEARRGFDLSCSFGYSVIGFEVDAAPGGDGSKATAEMAIDPWIGETSVLYADADGSSPLSADRIDVSDYSDESDRNRVRDLLESGLGTLAQITSPTSGLLMVNESFDYPWMNSLDVYFYARPAFEKFFPAGHRNLLRRFLAELAASDSALKSTNIHAGWAKAPEEYLEEVNRRLFAPHDLGSPWRIRTNSYTWRRISDWQDLLPKLVCMCCAEERRAPGFLSGPDYDLLTESLAAYDRYHGSPLPLSKGVSDTFDNWSKPGHSLYSCLVGYHARYAFRSLGGKVPGGGLSQFRSSMADAFLLQDGRYRSSSAGQGGWTIEPALDFWLSRESGAEPFFPSATRESLAKEIRSCLEDGQGYGVPNVLPQEGEPLQQRQKNAVWIALQFVVLYWLRREHEALFSTLLARLHSFLMANIPFGFPESLSSSDSGEVKYIASRYLRTLSSFLLEKPLR